jgi:L-ascorbate peroxidase
MQAPVILRLAYHDAGTYDAVAGDGGANASVQYELSREENFGLKRGWRVIEAAMAELKGTAAEGVVGYADLVALAGAYAVQLTGGPSIRVPIGKRFRLVHIQSKDM